VYWQKLLRLQDWVIEVKCIEAEKINDDDDTANVRTRFYTRRAIVTIARDREDKAIIGSIIHELLHIVLTDTDDVVTETRRRLSEPAATLAKDLYVGHNERAIDSICGALLKLRMENKPF